MFKRIVGGLVLTACFLTVSTVWAKDELVSVYIDDKQSLMPVVVRDEATYRIDLFESSRDPGVFVLAAAGKKWLAFYADSDVGWVAYEYKLLTEKAEKIAAAQEKAKPQITVNDAGVQKTGELEGRLFNVTYNQGGQTKNLELVLTRDKGVIAVTGILVDFLESAGFDDAMMLVESFRHVTKLNGVEYGLLRYDDKLTLQSLSKQDFADAYFTLPENITIMDNN